MLCRNGDLKLSECEKLDILISVTDTVVFLHQKKIVHRNIKPSNILLNKQKVPKLVDMNLLSLFYANDDDLKFEK